VKGKLIAVAMMAGVGFAAGIAKADPGIFGEPIAFDGSMDMRRSTTEQFDPIRGQSVGDRPRPDFDATPINIGSFQLFPAMNFTGYYDSNIFALDHSESSDFVWKANPAFSLLSNWGKNAIAISGFGDFDVYSANSEQNYNSGALQAEGRWDIAQQTWLAGSAAYQRVTELRASPNVPGNALGPSQYDLYTANADVYRGVGQLKIKAGVGSAYYIYSPIDLIGGGVGSQDLRDRFENNVHSEVGYEMTENFQPFVRAGYNWRPYTDGGSLHNSNGYNFDVGSKMDFGGITTASAYVGYMSQDYQNLGGTVPAFDFGGDVLWNVTELTSVELNLARSIEEADVLTASSIVDTNPSLTVTHELRRNIILEAHVDYYNLDYQNLSRHDDVYDGGFGGRYFINRRLYADATYDYERRGTDASGQNFNRNLILVRLGVQY